MKEELCSPRVNTPTHLNLCELVQRGRRILFYCVCLRGLASCEFSSLNFLITKWDICWNLAEQTWGGGGGEQNRLFLQQYVPLRLNCSTAALLTVSFVRNSKISSCNLTVSWERLFVLSTQILSYKSWRCHNWKYVKVGMFGNFEFGCIQENFGSSALLQTANQSGALAWNVWDRGMKQWW